MYVETYEIRFKIFNIQKIKNEILNYFNIKEDDVLKYFIKDIYIKNNYKHLENIRLRIENDKNYLIYKSSKLNKDDFYIFELESFFFLEKDILFLVNKNRIEYNLMDFKVLIDTNIKIKINNNTIFYQNIIEFEYYNNKHRDKIEKIIKYFKDKGLISADIIKSTYQKVLNENN